MSDTVNEAAGAVTAGEAASLPAPAARASTAEQPIPLWPEGVLAVAACVTLLVIGLRHRIYLQRKAREIQRAVEEFQRQGGVEDLTHVARQAADFLKGAGS
jgi:hypothetical protein